MSHMSRVLYWLALILAIGVAVYLTITPMYGEKMTWVETTPSGQQVQHTDGGTYTLLDMIGARVLAVFAIPLLLAALPLFMTKPIARRRAGLICGALLAIFSFVASWSIGAYFYPSAVALLVAGVATRVQRSEVDPRTA